MTAWGEWALSKIRPGGSFCGDRRTVEPCEVVRVTHLTDSNRDYEFQ